MAKWYSREVQEHKINFENEFNKIDWFNFKSTMSKKPELKYISIMGLKEEKPYDRKLRMLEQAANTCIACSMCELGLQPAEKNHELRDPHVFSNLNPTRFMVIGQNPGWNEVKQRQPFIGSAGKNFDNEISKHGLSRNDFYVTNAVKCFTPSNSKPSLKHKKRCEPFLQMEINIIKPLLVITLGEVAFSQFCPDSVYNESLKIITSSERYNVPVFAIYHPSPLNFRDSSRKELFEDQVKIMCKLVKALKKKHNA